MESIAYNRNEMICLENIVFNKNCPDTPKIIDFGDAELISDDGRFSEFVGTALYMAPERLTPHQGWQLKKSDVWAVGMLICSSYPLTNKLVALIS